MAKASVWKALFEKEERIKIKKPKAAKRFFTREISGSVTQNLKRMRSLRFFRLIDAMYELLAHISTRAYGAALMCFGLVSTLMYFLDISKDTSLMTPIIAIFVAGFSIPLLVTDKPLPVFLQEMKLTDFLFFEFFCLKRHSSMESERRFPIIAAMLIGLIPALLTSVVDLWKIALTVGVIICVYLAMGSPEFVFFTSLVALPYIRFIPHFTLIFAIALILATFSFARKVAMGRRVFYVEQYDIVLGVMLLCILISGIFIKGMDSLWGSVRMVVFALGYILAGNIITNRRLAELSAGSLIISGVGASVVSIVQFIIVLSREGFGVSQESLAHVLSREDGIAAFLMVSAVLSLGMINKSSKILNRVLSFSAVLCIIALVLSGEVLAITSLLLGLAAYFIIKSNTLPALLLPVLLVLSVLVLLLPERFLDIVFTYSPSVVSAHELFALWRKSAAVLLNNLLIGIGIGSESFAEEMAKVEIFGHADSSNLFLELGLEAGIFALLAFVILILVRMNHRRMQHIYVRSSEIAKMANLSGACFFSLLAFGMVNYIWSDVSAYYLFWCVFGLGSASLRVAKRDYDDRVVYYEESSALDSSVIDIEIR